MIMGMKQAIASDSGVIYHDAFCCIATSLPPVWDHRHRGLGDFGAQNHHPPAARLIRFKLALDDIKNLGGVM